jgi:hypothetical protein
MPTPTNRTPIRVARGTYSNLNASVADIQEGEAVYATDQNRIYVKEAGVLVSTQADTSAFLDSGDIGVSVQAYDADNAVTDVVQTFTAGQRGEVTTLTSSSGVLAIDFNASNNFYIQLSENVSSVTVSNATAGQSGSIFIAQPASGGPYTVGGWAGAFKFSGATAPTITATNSKTDRVDYVIRTASEIQVVWTGNY